MPRVKREVSSIGLYHIIIRGKDKLFRDEDDYECFYRILKKYYKGANLYAYCITADNIHLAVYDGGGVCIQIKPICTSYARYFNKKYERSGKIFYDRYKSECINSYEYLMDVIKFLHEKPRLEGENAVCYTSEAEYRSGRSGICAVSEVFKMAGGEQECIERLDSGRLVMCSDDYIRMDRFAIGNYIMGVCGVDVKDIKKLSRTEREKCIELIKCDGWISNRRIAEITGINRNFIDAAGKSVIDKKEPQSKQLDVWLL